MEADGVSTRRSGALKVIVMAKKTGILVADAPKTEMLVGYLWSSDLAVNHQARSSSRSRALSGLLLHCQLWQTVLSKYLIKRK